MSMSDQWPSAQAAVPAGGGSEAGTVKVTLSADTPYTEIRLLDARFEPVALSANTGRVEVDVPPGLYEAGFRTAEGWQGQHVLVQAKSGDIDVAQETTSLPRAEPVSPPQSFADDEATVVVDLVSPERSAEEAHGTAEPRSSITVTLINASNPSVAAKDLKEASGRVWRFVAAPGYWRLRIDEAHPREAFEIAVTVLPNYVAYVTAPVRGGPDRACVDLERFRFRWLQQGRRGAPDPELSAFEEVALAALGENRSLFGPALEELVDNLVDDKVANPMLGILAAHLCLDGGDQELQFQERLLSWLESISASATPDPDITALRIGHSMRLGLPLDAAAPVLFPPLLAASWRILLDASRQCPGLIPQGSIGDEIADRLWASSRWLAWTSPPAKALTATADLPATPVPRAASVEDASSRKAASPRARKVPGTRRASLRKASSPRAGGPRAAVATGPETEAQTVQIIDASRSPSANTAVIKTALSHPELRDWLRGALGGSSDAPQEGGHDPVVTPAEAAIASAVYPVAPTEEMQSAFQRLSDNFLTPDVANKLSSALDRADALGLPRSTIERALDSFATKLVDHALRFDIKL